MPSAEQLENVFDESATQDKSDANRRERSLIDFPYANLEDAERIAGALFEAAGMSEVSAAQAGDAIAVSSSSSTFRVLISAAKMFGVLTPERGSIRLTQLGQDIAHSETQRVARVAAFLRIPLYKALTDIYNGRTLPPAAALEREMAKLGVPSKQTIRARQSFDRSARHAGFIKAGSDRFVTPITSKLESAGDSSAPPAADEPRRSGGNGGNGHGGDGAALCLDPLLIELLRKIPSKEEGWPAAKRARWFRTFAMNVSQIYDKDDDPVELKIETISAVT